MNDEPQNEASPKDSEQLKSIRTYESDVADVLAKRNTSAVTIALAESRKNQGTESMGAANLEGDRPHSLGVKILIVILSIIFACGGVIGAYYLYSVSPLAPAPTIDTSQKVATLIPVDSQTVIVVDAKNPSDIKSKIQSELNRNQAPNTLRELALVAVDEKCTTTNNKCENLQPIRIPTQAMIGIMGIKIPDILLRSLTPTWLLGIYTNGSSEKSLFVIATNNFFQNTFAGMLQWESVMADDLKGFLPIPVTSAEGSTSPYTVISGSFQDRIIKNKDIREFLGGNGQLLFLYSFIDNDRLLFAVDEGVVTEIMTRLEKQSFIR